MRNLPGKSYLLALALTGGSFGSPSVQSAAALYKTSGAFALRLTIELKRDGEVKIVSPQSEFKNGDQIRLHFVSNLDGYVYAMNKPPSGETKVIFPTPETGADNMVRKDQDYTIPSTNGWFRLTGTAGAETVLMILSAKALPQVDPKLAASAAAPPPPAAASAAPPAAAPVPAKA